MLACKKINLMTPESLSSACLFFYFFGIVLFFVLGARVFVITTPVTQTLAFRDARSDRRLRSPLLLHNRRGIWLQPATVTMETVKYLLTLKENTLKTYKNKKYIFDDRMA